ncbi:MAG: hypothetical protein SXV54_10440, partial [Chloroflexota bacterium]|nr:hypothetical protein [Chloroflexota bacterium]
YENGQAYEGRASVYHGAADELSARPDWTAEGNQPYAWMSPRNCTRNCSWKRASGCRLRLVHTYLRTRKRWSGLHTYT